MMASFFLFFLPLFLIHCLPSSTESHHFTTYRAAVAPTQFHRNTTTDFDLEANVQYMIKQIQLASTVHSAQIVVFGEQQVNFPDLVPTECSWKLVLQTQAEYIPTININSVIIPCIDPLWQNRTIARRFSCAARMYSIYVAYSAYTSYPCNTDDFGPICPSGGFFVFNTLVVLDTKGALVAKYYKRSVQTEAPGAVQPTPDILRLIPDNPTFNTSFGVTFGNLICYDLTRGYPLSNYIKNNVRNIIWSNAFDGLPGFYTHVGLAQGTARAMKLNILCASAAGQGVSGGNAIVSGSKTLAINFRPATCVGDYYDQVPKECFDLVVADIPVVPLEPSSSSYGEGSVKTSYEHHKKVPPPAIIYDDDPPVSPEPYRCDVSQYLPDGIPSTVEPLLGLEANCVSDVASPGNQYTFFASFGEVTCFANFIISADSPFLSTNFTLRATEVTFWTPNSPCPLRLAGCYLSAQEPECTDYPSCPRECYDSLLRFSDIHIVAHVPSEYTVIPLAMETGGTMSTDKYGFTVNSGTRGGGHEGGSSSVDDSLTYEMAAQNVTVVFVSMLGDYSSPRWPFDCLSCYDPFKGPGFGEDASQFSLDSVRALFRPFMCQECLDNDGWKNETNWPPAWAKSGGG